MMWVSEVLLCPSNQNQSVDFNPIHSDNDAYVAFVNHLLQKHFI